MRRKEENQEIPNDTTDIKTVKRQKTKYKSLNFEIFGKLLEGVIVPTVLLICIKTPLNFTITERGNFKG